jgi:hypothetical protein
LTEVTLKSQNNFWLKLEPILLEYFIELLEKEIENYQAK